MVLDRMSDTAARLHCARLERRPIVPLTMDWPELTESEAYAIAEKTARLHDDPVIGFKLGYTSAAMRKQMNVESPNFGFLFASTRVGDDGAISSSKLIHPLVEPEIAVVLGRAIDHPCPSREQVFSAIDAVMPAIEVVDTRYERYEFRAVDNIADNSSAARFIVGAPRAASSLGDLRTITASLWSNGRTLERGTGADVMGDPLLALAWFIGRRVQDGRPIPVGSVILTGGVTSAHPAPLGSAFVAEFGSLGTVKAYFDA